MLAKSSRPISRVPVHPGTARAAHGHHAVCHRPAGERAYAPIYTTLERLTVATGTRLPIRFEPAGVH